MKGRGDRWDGLTSERMCKANSKTVLWLSYFKCLLHAPYTSCSCWDRLLQLYTSGFDVIVYHNEFLGCHGSLWKETMSLQCDSVGREKGETFQEAYGIQSKPKHDDGKVTTCGGKKKLKYSWSGKGTEYTRYQLVFKHMLSFWWSNIYRVLKMFKQKCIKTFASNTVIKHTDNLGKHEL